MTSAWLKMKLRAEIEQIRTLPSHALPPKDGRTLGPMVGLMQLAL